MRALLAFVLVCFSLNSYSQTWPAKPLRYIVPFPPGAFNDTLGRTISAELAEGADRARAPQSRPDQLRQFGERHLGAPFHGPEVPTVAEAGVPGYELAVWFGVLAPAGTPRDVVARLNAEIVKVLNSPGIKAD